MDWKWKKQKILRRADQATEEKTDARQDVLFRGLNSWLTNKTKQAVWDYVATAVNKVGQKDRTVADIKKK